MLLSLSVVNSIMKECYFAPSPIYNFMHSLAEREELVAKNNGRERVRDRERVQWRSQDRMKTLVDVEKKESDISFMLDSFEHRKKRVIITFTSLQVSR